MMMQKAISKETGEWVYGTYFDGFILSGEVIEATDEYITIEEWHPVKRETLCQCLNIKDGEGRLIYEHDVMQSVFKADDEATFTIRKISDAKGFGAYAKTRPGYPYQLSYIVPGSKVIGNEKGYLAKAKEDNKWSFQNILQQL